MPVDPTIVNYAGEGDRGTKTATWALTTANPIGTAVQWAAWPDKTWTLTGTVGAATCEIQGSNIDVESSFTLQANATDGTGLTYGAVPQNVMQAQNPSFSRPELTTVGSGASWSVVLTARRSHGPPRN